MLNCQRYFTRALEKSKDRFIFDANRHEALSRIQSIDKTLILDCFYLLGFENFTKYHNQYFTCTFLQFRIYVPYERFEFTTKEEDDKLILERFLFFPDLFPECDHNIYKITMKRDGKTLVMIIIPCIDSSGYVYLGENRIVLCDYMYTITIKQDSIQVKDTETDLVYKGYSFYHKIYPKTVLQDDLNDILPDESLSIKRLYPPLRRPNLSRQ